MAIAKWHKQIETAAVTVFAANADLMTVARKVEAGIIDRVRFQEITSLDIPLIAIKAYGYGADKGDGPVGMTVHDVKLRAQIVTVHARQLTAEETMMDILAQIAVVVGQEKKGNRFSLSNTTGEIDDVGAGSGDVIACGEPKDSEVNAFLCEGEYLWTVQYRLNL